MRRHIFEFPNYLILLFALYKIHFFNIFLIKNLHISKKSSTFAVKLKDTNKKLYKQI